MLVLCASGSARATWAADTIPFQRFTTADGLPHDFVTALAQSADGRLWVGTRVGVSVYDGMRIHAVALPDSLRRGSVAALQPMPDGSMWIAFDQRGLVRVRNGRVLETALSGVKTVDLLAHDGTLWVAAADAVWRRRAEDARFQKRSLGYSIRPPAMLEAHPEAGTGPYDIARGPHGEIWVLDGRRGPGRLRRDGTLAFLGPSTHPDSLWISMATDAPGRLLLTRRHHNTLVALAPDTGTQDVLARQLPGANYVFREGAHAYVTTVHGFRRLPPTPNGTALSFGPAQGLPDVIPTTIHDAPHGGLWIGTLNGLLHVPRPDARHVTTLDGVVLRNVNRFMTGAAGDLWAHSYGTGLLQLRPVRTQVTPNEHRGWGQGVHSADGSAHALTTDHWYRHAPGRGWTRVRPTPGAVRGEVDVSGVGFFWHDDGLYRWPPDPDRPPKRLVAWPPEQRGQHHVTRTPSGALLVRAREMLLRVDPNASSETRLDTLAQFPEFAEARGRYMEATNRGDVWMASGTHGLIHLNPRIGTDAHRHLPGEPLTNVTPLGDSLVLASARSGLFVVDAATGATQTHLTRVDGLLNTDVNDAIVYGDSLYVSHSNGLTVLPAEAVQLPAVPHATITGVTVDQRARTVSDTLRLAPDARSLQVTYAAPHLRNPDRVRFEYRLLPGDSTWQSTDQPSLRLASLAPGSYRFEVRARMAARLGSPAVLRFAVAPSLYETTWVRLLGVLFLLALVALGYRWRVRALQRRKADLQRRVQQQTKALRAEKQTTEAQARRLAALDEAKNRFFANLSHEFRTPLTLLLGPLRDLLNRDDLAPTDRTALDTMQRSAERLQRLIHQLLDLSKLTAGRMDLNRQPVDVVAFARRMHEAFVPLAERQHVDLRFRAAVELLPAALDPTHLETILSNLLSNAVKFTPHDGTVWLTAGQEDPPDGDTVRLVVKDTGPGISEADLQRIFDRFEQVDGSTTRPHEGTGIGLSLTRELVRLHGGTIGVESEVGHGSAFTVRLPRAAPGDDPPERGHLDPEPALEPRATNGVAHDAPTADDSTDVADDRSPLPGSAAPSPDAPVVLIAEDNADVRAYLRRHLSDTYRVRDAENGADALAMIQETPPDLLVCDVMMPKMDGLALCEAIKSDAALRTLPVLMLTAKATPDDTVAGLDCGADDYVTKPFDIRELKQRVARLLNVRATLKATYQGTLHVESVDLDVDDADAAFLQAVLHALDDHLSDADFSVDHLAQSVALSRRQLTRRFRDVTGETPAAFIRGYRLDRAAEHLADGHAGTIAELAYSVGFGSASYFSTAFKKRFGCPPSHYPENGV